MFCHSLNKCGLIICSVGNVPTAKWKDKKANALPIFAFKRQVIDSPGEETDIVKNSPQALVGVSDTSDQFCSGRREGAGKLHGELSHD